MPSKHNPFSIKALANNAVEIFIYGDIGDSWDDESTTAARFVKDLAALEADAITLRINSPGGSVTDGLAIYNALKRHPATVTVEIDGIAASIASLIAMAGDTVNMASNALYMIHAPWGFSIGNANEMRDMADTMDKFASAMAEAYADGTGKEASEFMALMSDGKDHWYTAAEAEAAGYVNQVTEALPIAASIEKTFDLTRFPKFAKQAPAAAAAIKPEEPAMPDPVKKPAAEPQATAPTEPEIRAKLQQEETARREGINAKFDLFKGREDLAELKAACLDDFKVTAEQAGEKILAKLAEGSEPIQGRVTVVEDERDVKRAAAVEAIMARAGVNGIKADRNNPYRGYKLLDIAKDSLEASGSSTRGLDQMKIVANAFTQGTSDFPVILEDAMHKTLQTSYASASDTWSRFCATGSVSDFRAHSRYRLGSLGNLDSLNEHGEYKYKAIPDGEKATIQADTVGNIISLTRKAIVNDDLSAFIGLANMLGRAAARTIEATVYALLAENSGKGPTMDDGKSLFHADHGNIGTAGGLSVATLEAMRVLMASQKDISGNDFLDLRPANLLVPMGLGGTARVINSAEYDPDTSGKMQRPNMVRGLFSDVIDTPRLSGTGFYTFASPTEAPVIEVAFLDGNQEPYLEMQEGFDVDGTKYKVRHDFGVAALDYRGAAYNAGQ
ncbi:ATP-dependent Clp protease proteolytic subunit [Streptosporangium jomthongense]|uniref:ATP-dependent Clp protease proteolytic subunit n=1 Tax=Marinobacter aromaticivorans TaxID=1494078 RepID=A0ABW2IXY6_9GAMM|nr:ClpP-like prohead protease/major capsid protein fusion protein [Marinobacter aromaticivorans]GGE75895.1 ATP-dependent Clp protease proteolytic subunit [Streptosporangium jomthongense]